jgi:predicted RNA-binding Zn ribbon-like protein
MSLLTTLSQSHPFQLVAGHVALDFVNTLDNRCDPERSVDLLPTYSELVAFAGQYGLVNPAQARVLLAATSERQAMLVLDRAIRLREALYQLFRAAISDERPSSEDIETLNASLSEARSRRQLTWDGKDFVWRYRGFPDQPASPIWPIVEAAAELLSSGDRARIRECSNETCRWLFLDQSKNHSRRWCDMSVCGNRAKARRFHARERGVFRNGAREG